MITWKFCKSAYRKASQRDVTRFQIRRKKSRGWRRVCRRPVRVVCTGSDFEAFGGRVTCEEMGVLHIDVTTFTVFQGVEDFTQDILPYDAVAELLGPWDVQGEASNFAAHFTVGGLVTVILGSCEVAFGDVITVIPIRWSCRHGHVHLETSPAGGEGGHEDTFFHCPTDCHWCWSRRFLVSLLYNSVWRGCYSVCQRGFGKGLRVCPWLWWWVYWHFRQT